MNHQIFKTNPSNKHSYLTKEGLDELKVKLDKLRKERFELCERLRKMDAQEKTDCLLTTNDIAVLERNELEVKKIADIIRSAVLVEKNDNPTDVRLGSTVDLRFGEQTIKFTLVNPIEADPSMHKISERSPLGRALFGRKKHETVHFVTPKGKTVDYRIDAIA